MKKLDFFIDIHDKELRDKPKALCTCHTTCARTATPRLVGLLGEIASGQPRRRRGEYKQQPTVATSPIVSLTLAPDPTQKRQGIRIQHPRPAVSAPLPPFPESRRPVSSCRETLGHGGGARHRRSFVPASQVGDPAAVRPGRQVGRLPRSLHPPRRLLLPRRRLRGPPPLP
jgi:hypothetical protein